MDRYVTGMLARSKAGHDTGKIYVIIDVDETYVYLADGRENDVTAADDAAIRKIIKEKGYNYVKS